jgi:hypothetical protein
VTIQLQNTNSKIKHEMNQEAQALLAPFKLEAVFAGWTFVHFLGTFATCPASFQSGVHWNFTLLCCLL